MKKKSVTICTDGDRKRERYRVREKDERDITICKDGERDKNL